MENMHLFTPSVAAYFSKRFERDLLVPGSHPVQFRVNGSANGEKLSASAKGELIVAQNQVRTTSNKPRLDVLVALLLHQIPKNRRQKACDMVRAHFLDEAIDQECDTAGKLLISSLITTSSAEIRGSIAFSPA